jgi:cytochrome bd ubiquinol oxidase subunit I
VVFWSFRIMVALGMLMIFAGVFSLWLRWRDGLYQSRKPFLYFILWMGPSGLIAILAGWFTTEIGRQPWVVYGLMRTAKMRLQPQCDAHEHHPGAVCHGVLRPVRRGVLGYMMRLVRKGPVTHESRTGPRRPRAETHPGASAVCGR